MNDDIIIELLNLKLISHETHKFLKYLYAQGEIQDVENILAGFIVQYLSTTIWYVRVTSPCDIDGPDWCVDPGGFYESGRGKTYLEAAYKAYLNFKNKKQGTSHGNL